MAAVLASSDNVGYVIGQITGTVLILALGVWLLVTGIQKRKATSAPPPGPTWAPPPGPDGEPAAEWQAVPAAPAPQTTGGTGRIIAGALIIGLSALGGVGQLAGAASYPKRTISLSPTVLGAAQNAELTNRFRGQFLSTLPKGLKDGDLAVYGTPTPTLIVIAGVGKLSSPSAEISSFRKGAASNGQVTLSNTHAVEAGELGGKGECSDATFAGLAKAQVCIYADRGSLMAVIDLGASSADGASRSLQVRNAVVHKG
jgi:hypothetical protein